MTDQYEVLHDLSIGAIFNDPERPIFDVEYGINGTR